MLLAKRLSVFGTTLRSRPVDGAGGKGEVAARPSEVTWPPVETGRVVPDRRLVFDFDDAAAAHAQPTVGMLWEGVVAFRCVRVPGWSA